MCDDPDFADHLISLYLSRVRHASDWEKRTCKTADAHSPSSSLIGGIDAVSCEFAKSRPSRSFPATPKNSFVSTIIQVQYHNKGIIFWRPNSKTGGVISAYVISTVKRRNMTGSCCAQSPLSWSIGYMWAGGWVRGIGCMENPYLERLFRVDWSSCWKFCRI